VTQEFVFRLAVTDQIRFCHKFNKKINRTIKNKVYVPYSTYSE
jgi:hypothetical protein